MKEQQTMITNTTKQDPPLHLATMMFGGGIEEQEKQGQQELCESMQLPSNGDWDGLAKIGVKRGNLVEGDDVFVHAELPPGWQIKPTDHSMWSKLVDENGVEKASIFYKAAFYDRCAFIRLAE